MAPDKFGIELRKKIIQDYESGKNQSEISKKYTIHKSSVSRIISHFNKYGTCKIQHLGGRPRKTTARDDSLIIREIQKDPFVSSNTLVKKLEIPVSSRTIRRRAVERGLLSRRPSKKPLISNKNQKKRLIFARKYISWDVAKWKTVLFSDESKYLLVGTDGMCRVRRPRGKRLQPQFCQKTLKHGGGNVMVWGCFSGQGLGPIHKIDGIMDRFIYKNILENIMLPYAEWNMPLKWIFQQDNDPKHTSKVVKKWFKTQKIDMLDWPPQSPDINPIENLWQIVEQKIVRDNVRTKDQLFDQIKKAWSEVSPDVIRNLIESMPRRLRAVIENKGFATKY